jgi:hypothetical protein
MWVICNNHLYRILLEVPRTIYISSEATSENPDFKPVKKILPQNRQVKYLYEYTMPEQEFLDRYYEIMSTLNEPRVEGLHEMKTPLLE